MANDRIERNWTYLPRLEVEPTPERVATITPEMIEAGIEAYFSKRRFPHDDIFDEEAAVRVFNAMWSSMTDATPAD